MVKMLNIIRQVPPKEIFTVIDKSLRGWRGIMVHHTATKAKRGKRQVFDVEKYHRYDKEWSKGMGYHLFIDVDGVVFFGERWREQADGAHCPYYNGWLGICFAGHFNKQEPTEQQLRAFRKIVEQFKPELKIIPHRAKKNTDCPGKKIDFAYWFSIIDPV